MANIKSFLSNDNNYTYAYNPKISTCQLLRPDITYDSSLFSYSEAYGKLPIAINTPLFDSRSFSKIRILSENKVVEVTFADGQKVKTICDDESEFSLEFALYLSLAKRLYSDKYTSEGVWRKALDMKYEKYFVKLVQDGLKMYKKEQKEKEDLLKKQEEEKQRIAKKKAKKIAYKKRREERRKADQIDVIVQAMKIANETK